MTLKKTVRSFSFGAALVGLSVLADSATNAAQATCTQQPYIGSICMTAAPSCPTKYFLANGQILPITVYYELFSVIGTLYGGDGRTTFALPDMRGRTPVGVGAGQGLVRVLVGQKRGSETINQELLQMAAHTHAAKHQPGSVSKLTVDLKASATQTPDLVTPKDGAFIAQTGEGLSASPSFSSTPEGGLVSLSGASVGGKLPEGTVTVYSSGGSYPMQIIPPQLGLTYCIAAYGLLKSKG